MGTENIFSACSCGQPSCGCRSTPQAPPTSPLPPLPGTISDAVGVSDGQCSTAVVSAPRSTSKKVFSPRPLKPSQERFIAAFTDPSLPTFGNAKQSYLKAHPHVTEGSAEVLGSQTLGNVRVRAAVVGSGEALTLEKALEHLKWNVDETKAHHRYADHREVIKVWLQATGHWVEKRQQETVEPPVSSQELEAELERRCNSHAHKDL